MNREFIELSPNDPDPAVACDRGVALVAATDLRLHAPDRRMLAIEDGSLIAQCSYWWTGTPPLGDKQLGIIGHYASADPATGVAVLSLACAALANAGCTHAVGPMDGNTWRRYRFIVERGQEPVFFLEPDQPDDWPSHWTVAGFEPLATYSSALNDRLDVEDPRTDAARARLADAGVAIRPFDPAQAEAELRRLYRLSLVGFSRNFLYTPIAEAEFMAQNQALLPHVRPELVLLAEREGELVGFMFAVPDLLQARRGSPVDTVVLKTIAVDPAMAGQGLGGVLLDLVQRAARRMGFRRAIHALIHETNVSGRISGRYARTIRRYALFSQPLADFVVGDTPGGPGGSGG